MQLSQSKLPQIQLHWPQKEGFSLCNCNRYIEGIFRWLLSHSAASYQLRRHGWEKVVPQGSLAARTAPGGPRIGEGKMWLNATIVHSHHYAAAQHRAHGVSGKAKKIPNDKSFNLKASETEGFIHTHK